MSSTQSYPWIKQAHETFRIVLIAQLVLAFVIGFITDTLLIAALIGVPIAIVPILLGLKLPDEAVSRHAVGIATQLMAALHIQLTFGMTEMHFQVFVMLAFLFFFRDWKVVISSVAVVAVHHVLFFILQYQNTGFVIVDEGKTTFLILVIHAAFAVAEAIVLAIMANRSHHEALVSLSLQQSVDKITAQGDVIDLSDENLVRSDDLSAFNNMMRTVKSLIEQVNQVGDNLALVVSKVSNSSHELDMAVDKQDHQVSSIKSAMQNMTSSISEVASLSQNANQLAEQAKHSTDETKNALEGSSSNIGELRSTLETTSVAIGDLSGKCMNISEVMQSIKSVAEQTNLLALNAAIESARAGEHGRGFAVVADEVRNLAIKSKESAEEIELITSQLTESANHSVKNMENCVKIVAMAVESSGQASNNMSSVMNNIDTVNNNVTTVAGSATEQAQTSEAISTSAEELYSLFMSEKQQVDSLRNDVLELSAIAEQLRAQLKNFRVH